MWAQIRDGAPEPLEVVKVTRDEAADARCNPVSSQPQSVPSGRTVERVADEERAAAIRR
jgi:hypothetical protein